MVVANTTSGATHSFDLRDPSSMRDLISLIQSNQVTALAILNDGAQQVLPMPKRFRGTPSFGVELVSNGKQEPIAERVYAHVGDIRVSLTRTYKSKLVRCDLVRMGFQRYSPTARG